MFGYKKYIQYKTKSVSLFFDDGGKNSMGLILSPEVFYVWEGRGR